MPGFFDDLDELKDKRETLLDEQKEAKRRAWQARFDRQVPYSAMLKEFFIKMEELGIRKETRRSRTINFSEFEQAEGYYIRYVYDQGGGYGEFASGGAAVEFFVTAENYFEVQGSGIVEIPVTDGYNIEKWLKPALKHTLIHAKT